MAFFAADRTLHSPQRCVGQAHMGLVGEGSGAVPADGRIEIRLQKMQQLFNSFDPSPFISKDLDDEAEAQNGQGVAHCRRDRPRQGRRKRRTGDLGGRGLDGTSRMAMIATVASSRSYPVCFRRRHSL
jgi:hypothetical protein